MTILAIALVMLCLGSVSAVDDEKLNSTLETVNDISQDENIVIDEIANDGYADVASSKGETSSVSVAGEKQNKEILKASDDEVLGADTTGYISIRETNTETDGSFDGVVGEQIGIDVYWRSLSGMQFALLVNGAQDQTFYPSGWGGGWSDTLYYTPQTAGHYTFQVICQGSSSRYVSNVLTWDVSGSAKTETETSISITPSTVAPNEEFTINYNVYEKGTTNAVNEGTISFYDQNGQIGSSINLANPTTFTYSYSNKKSYNIYAVYAATDNYKDSESSKVRLAVKEDGDPDPVIVLKITDAYDSSTPSTKYAFSDDYTLLGVYSNAKYTSTVTFSIEFINIDGAGAVIKYGKDLDNLNEQTVSGDSASITFNSDVTGINYVYVEQDGVESNRVTVKVATRGSSATLNSLNPDYGVEGTQVSVTPSISRGSGNVTFYSSSSYSADSKLGTVSTNGGVFTVPFLDDNTYECDWVTIYYAISSESGSTAYFGKGSIDFLVINSNPISLTGNGGVGNVEVDSQNKVNLHVVPTYYRNDGTKSFIEVYVDGSIVGTFTVSGEKAVNDYVLDMSDYDSGDYDVYVKYLGYEYSDDSSIEYYAANESNHLTVVVPETTVDGFSISVTSPTYNTHPIATITGQAGETYVITIREVPSLSFSVTIPEGQSKVTQDLGLLDVSSYTAVVTHGSETNETTFTVNKGTPSITVTASGNNTGINEAHSITVNSDVEGKITINGESQQYD